MAKAPNYMKINSYSYYCKCIEFKKLKVGDVICVSFGRERQHEIEYKVIAVGIYNINLERV